MDKPTCETCPFWNKQDAQSPWGECRRHTPLFQPDAYLTAVTIDPDDEERSWFTFMGSFPLTEHDWWCGDHPDFNAYLDAKKPRQCDFQKHDNGVKQCTLELGHKGRHVWP